MMTNHVDRPSAKDAAAHAGTATSVSGSASGKPAPAAGSSGEARDTPKADANPQLSEAIDRATAAAGQDDGKR